MTKQDYTSKVPKRQYSTTLAEQKAELAADILIDRFKTSREAFASDIHRPRYHFVSPESTLNDPNGLCFWQGKWHLFYQGYPPEDPRQHWGHAISDDLIQWRDLPYAIYPNPEKCCFSGATFVEDDRVIAMYHGTEVGNMVAVSSDPLLLNWEKLTGEAVIPFVDADDYGRPYRVFDPCIWREGEHYYSLSGWHIDGLRGVDGRKINHIFRSKDLVSWTYMGEFVENLRFQLAGDDGACPYFWPIGEKHILLTFSHRRSAQYIIGEYDTERQRLIAETSGSLNCGAVGNGSIHAPSAFPDGDGDLNVIYNVNAGKPTDGWNQIMSLPRKYTLSEQGKLLIEPTGDYASLRSSPVSLKSVALPANQEVVFEQITGKSLEVRAVFEPGPSRFIDLNVFRGADKSEFTSISYRRDVGLAIGGQRGRRMDVVTIDPAYSTVAPDVTIRGPETAEVELAHDEPVDLHIFIDQSIVEVFVNGKQALLLRVYPEKPGSNGFSITSRGNDATCRTLDAWVLASIYE
jgi:beta-fructofuranosidase